MFVRSQSSYGRNARTIAIFVRSQSSYGRNRKFDFANHDYFLMAVLQNIRGYEGCCGPRTGVRGALRTNSPMDLGMYLKGAKGVTDMILKPCHSNLEKDIISK